MHRPTGGSQGGAVSCERGTPVPLLPHGVEKLLDVRAIHPISSVYINDLCSRHRRARPETVLTLEPAARQHDMEKLLIRTPTDY